ncbi:hypothetical protein [Priestia aryabhattai]
MAIEQNMFNEDSFIDFLYETTSAKSQSFDINISGENKTIELMKTYDPSGAYALVYDLTPVNITDLSSLSPGQVNKFCGIYFKYEHYFVYCEGAVLSHIKDQCNEIKLYSREVLLNDIYKKANTVLSNRIKELKDEEGDPVFTKLIAEKESKKGQPIGEYKFRKYQPYNIVRQYIEDPSEAVSNFVDDFLERSKSVKMQKTEKICQMYYDKLKHAKTIWVTLESGDRKKVKREIKVCANVVRIGAQNEGIEIDDVVSVEYNGVTIPLLEDENLNSGQDEREVFFL